MLKVGLTGNIGSGKTTVAKIFEKLGVRIYYSDSESKKLLDQPDVIKRLREAFGIGVVAPNGLINKAYLAEVVFDNPHQLSQLNSILHPLVMDDFRGWCERNANEPYVINEAAIIFESGVREQFDRIIQVSCPTDIAIQRVVQRDEASVDAILKRRQFQWSDEEKSLLADFVLTNDNRSLVIPQILAIHSELLSIAVNTT